MEEISEHIDEETRVPLTLCQNQPSLG
jgi:hypothetical protein